MKKIFQIGSFCFQLDYENKIKLPTAFYLFEKAEGRPECIYEITVSEGLPVPEGRIIARRPDILISSFENRESRLIGIKGSAEYYACYQEIADDRVKVTFRTDKLQGLHVDPVFSSLLALERKMLMHESLIFHCAYLCHEGEAILFSGPSGMGKSTQAKLWEMYQNGETINGDRALLQKEAGKWIAHGWPVSGTSGICNNKSMPIKAIVMLGQNTENRVRRMTTIEAVQSLYTQVTVNYWNVPFVQKTLDILEDLVAKIPIYYLECNISEEAVRCLYDVMENLDKKP